MSMTSKDLWAHVCRTATLILKEVIIWILQNYSIFQSLQLQMSPASINIKYTSKIGPFTDRKCLCTENTLEC